MTPTFLKVCTYPNPAPGDAVWVECALDAPAILTVQVYTMDGKLVKIMTDAAFQPTPGRLARRCAWNLTDDFQEGLANGVYFCYGIARSAKQTQTHCWKMTVRR
jgi:hypothetical protein